VSRPIALLAQEPLTVDVEFGCEHLDCDGSVEGDLGASKDDAESAAAHLEGVIEADVAQLPDDGGTHVALRPERIAVHHYSLTFAEAARRRFLRCVRA
jgi:hypothetical protein